MNLYVLFMESKCIFVNIIFLFLLNVNRSDYTEGWYQDENGDWYQADPTEGKKLSSNQQSTGNLVYL